MNLAVWVLIYLIQGGGGEDGAFRGKLFGPEEGELCKQAALALTLDPQVLAVSECQKVILVPAQVKKK